MDYDADGDLDILSGSYTGELYLFERKADGGFVQGRYLLNNKGEDLKAARVGDDRARPAHELVQAAMLPDDRGAWS